MSDSLVVANSLFVSSTRFVVEAPTATEDDTPTSSGPFDAKPKLRINWFGRTDIGETISSSLKERGYEIQYGPPDAPSYFQCPYQNPLSSNNTDTVCIYSGCTSSKLNLLEEFLFAPSMSLSSSDPELESILSQFYRATLNRDIVDRHNKLLALSDQMLQLNYFVPMYQYTGNIYMAEGVGLLNSNASAWIVAPRSDRFSCQ